MKTITRKFISLVMTALLCVSFLPAFSFADIEDIPEETTLDNYNCVLFGDSMSKGYMFTDYDDSDDEHYWGWQGSSKKAFGNQFVQSLKDYYPNIDYKDLSLHGLMPDQVIELLNNDEAAFKANWNNLSQCARDHFDSWIGDIGSGKYQVFDSYMDMSNYYTDAVKNADVIVYDMGINYFGTYLSERLMNGRGDKDVTPTLNDKEINQSISTLRNTANLVSKAGVDADTLDNAIDVIEYSMKAYAVYTDACIAKIRELNPDAEIMLLGIYNPFRDMYLDLGILGKLNLSNKVDDTPETLNAYIKNRSPHRKEYTYIDLTDPAPECFTNALRNKNADQLDEDTLENVKKLLIELGFDISDPAQLKVMLNACCKAVTSYRSFDIETITCFLTGKGDVDADISRLFDGNTRNDKAADYQLLHWKFLFGDTVNGFGVHPSPEGINTKYRALEKAFASSEAKIAGAKTAATEALDAYNPSAKASVKNYNTVTVKWNAPAADSDIKLLVNGTDASGTSKDFAAVTGESNSYTLQPYIYYAPYKGCVLLGNKSTVKATPMLGKTTLKLSKGKKSFKAKWSKVTGANGYQLAYKLNKKGAKYKTVTIKSGSMVSKTVNKLKKKKTYYVKVRAYTVNSKGKTVYSSYTAAKKIKTK